MRNPRRRAALALVFGTAVAGLALSAGAARAAGPSSDVVLGGTTARFEVLTPTLIRMEYAVDGAFEDRQTETALNRSFTVPAFTTSTSAAGVLTITTGAMTLTYTGGPFTAATVSVVIASTGTTAMPTWDATGCVAQPTVCQTTGGTTQDATLDPTALGYYTREIVSENTADIGPMVGKYTTKYTTVGVPAVPVPDEDARVPYHVGFLHNTGYTLLDDSATAVRTSATTAGARATTPGYQDGYFFGYGKDYLQGLQDFNDLTGHTVLLPRWTFGPWFSRYADMKDTDYKSIVGQFRDHAVPLDGLVLDTDYKAPDKWNGWSWNTDDFPDANGFVDWAKAQDLHLTLNIHPSIDETDPKYAVAQTTAKGTLTNDPLGCAFYRTDASTPKCDDFDWGNPDQVKAYFDLHSTFTTSGSDHAGVDTLWLDYCCDGSKVSTAGLTPDSWINDLYASYERQRGHRGYLIAHVGSGIYDDNPETGDVNTPGSPWAAHRDAIHVTGDATSDFATLAEEAKVIPAEGEALDEAYLTNDIGGYNGVHDSDDLYARWVQMGAFSSIDRLHSKNGDRLPWQYLPATETATERFLRLREALVPYTYDSAEQANRTGAPITRALQLEYPDDATAATVTDEWMYGDSMLVAPISTAGTTATRSVYLPAGRWTDFFTGDVTNGPSTVTTPVEGFDRMPVYVKAGGIVPLAPPVQNVEQVADPLTIRVGSGAPGGSSLYSDAGDGQGYEHGESTRQPLTYTEPTAAGGVFVIGAQTGSYPGMTTARGYDVQFLSTDRPQNVTIDGALIPEAADSTSVPRQAGAQDMTVTSDEPDADGWTYDPVRRVVTVDVARRSTATPITVAHDVRTSPATDLPEAPLASLLAVIGAAGAGFGLWRRRRRA